jgi:hypothetical protein
LDHLIQDDEGMTPLHLICASLPTGWKGRIDALLDAGCDSTLQSITGKTALHILSEKLEGCVGGFSNFYDRTLVGLLDDTTGRGAQGRIADEDKRPDLDAVDLRGLTCLHLVVRAGEDYLKKAIYLVEKGANPTIKDKQGHSVYEYCTLDMRRAIEKNRDIWCKNHEEKTTGPKTKQQNKASKAKGRKKNTAVVDAAQDEGGDAELDFRVGEKVDAKWEEDEAWYDAEITEIDHDEEKFHVRFLFDSLLQWTARTGLRLSRD